LNQHGSEHEADRGDHRVRAHRETEFLPREGVGYEGRGVREQERGADALQDPPEDQDRRIGGEARTERGEREQQEAADVGALASKQIAQPACHENENRRCDQVGEDHPHERQQACMQRPLEIGQRDDQRA
jgi:hypothetical protein